MITGHARLAGVIGWPVSHSRSPLLHNHWLAQHAIDGAYVPLAVRPEDFATVVQGLAAAGFAGANVTIPHKEAAFAVCRHVDETARAAGAVNTLVFGAGGITGSNTDGAGFLANLAAHGVRPGPPTLLLGAGGAARAIAAALRTQNVPVTLANRSPDRAEALTRAIPGLRTLPWSQRSAAAGEYGLIVNTTSLGMAGHPALEIDLAGAGTGCAVADIVYAPLETRLVAQARALGLTAIPGLGMLIHQAVPGFASWFGVTPIVDQACHDLLARDLSPA